MSYKILASRIITSFNNANNATIHQRAKRLVTFRLGILVILLSYNLWYRRYTTKNHAISQLGSQAFTKRRVCKISYRQFSPRPEGEGERKREREKEKEWEKRGKH